MIVLGCKLKHLPEGLNPLGRAKQQYHVQSDRKYKGHGARVRISRPYLVIHRIEFNKNDSNTIAARGFADRKVNVVPG
jgi:hypothetical protein